MVALYSCTCYSVHSIFAEVIPVPTLYVRNVPNELYARLRQQAQANRRSISAEVIVLLNQALPANQRTQSEVLASIKRRRFFRPVSVGAPDSVTLLREDLDQ